MRKANFRGGCRRTSRCSGCRRGQCHRSAPDDRPAGRLLGAARRSAQGRLGEGRPRPAGAVAARRRHRQRARHRGRQGRGRLRQHHHHGRRRRGHGRGAARQEAREGLQHRHPLSAVLPGGGERRQRHQLDQGHQGQGLRHPGKGQHRRADRAPRAQGVRHDLQRREGRLHQQLHRQRRADEGQPHADVHARHRHSGQLHHGPGLGARHQAAGPERDSTRT